MHLLQVRRGKESPDAKEVALHRDKDLIDARQRLDGARHPDDGVQLVDITVGFDAGVVLLDPTAAEEAGVARVAGLCIDLHSAGNLRLSEIERVSTDWELRTYDYRPGALGGSVDGCGLVFDFRTHHKMIL